MLLWGHCGAGGSVEGWMRWSEDVCPQGRGSNGEEGEAEVEIGVLGICVIVGCAVVFLW